jgi:asparaginyl-tRNA synthetase
MINLEFRNLVVTSVSVITMRATRLRAASSKSSLPPTIRSRLSPTLLENAGPSSEKGEEVKIDGWLKSVRGHKNVVFAEVNDGSSSEGLQAVFKGSSRVSG